MWTIFAFNACLYDCVVGVSDWKAPWGDLSQAGEMEESL